MGTDGAWDGMGANGTLEARASDLRFVARAGRDRPLDNCSCRNPGTEALDSAEEMERTAVRALA